MKCAVIGMLTSSPTEPPADRRRSARRAGGSPRCRPGSRSGWARRGPAAATRRPRSPRFGDAVIELSSDCMTSTMIGLLRPALQPTAARARRAGCRGHLPQRLAPARPPPPPSVSTDCSRPIGSSPCRSGPARCGCASSGWNEEVIATPSGSPASGRRVRAPEDRLGVGPGQLAEPAETARAACPRRASGAAASGCPSVPAANTTWSAVKVWRSCAHGAGAHGVDGYPPPGSGRTGSPWSAGAPWHRAPRRGTR